MKLKASCSRAPDAERHYHETGKFDYVNTGGYYHSLPGDPLRSFIDTTAEVQRSMGFQNERTIRKLHPRNLRLTTATAKSWLLRIKFSSTS